MKRLPVLYILVFVSASFCAGQELPLHYAAEHANLAGAKRAIEGNPDVVNNFQDGVAALHVAVGYRNAEMVALLIENGADVDIRTRTTKHLSASGWAPADATSLHVATASLRSYLDEEDYKSTLAIVELLVSHGADVNALDADGKLPAQYAQEFDAEYRDKQVLEYLLHHGALVHTPKSALRETGVYLLLAIVGLGMVLVGIRMLKSTEGDPTHSFQIWWAILGIGLAGYSLWRILVAVIQLFRWWL